MNYCFPKVNGCGVLSVLEPQSSMSPHIHAIVYSPYVPQEVLSCAWRALTDSYVVDIRQIRSVSDALEYVFKYISKPPRNLETADDVCSLCGHHSWLPSPSLLTSGSGTTLGKLNTTALDARSAAQRSRLIRYLTCEVWRLSVVVFLF